MQQRFDAWLKKIRNFFRAWWEYHFPRDTSIGWDDGDEEYRRERQSRNL